MLLFFFISLVPQTRMCYVNVVVWTTSSEPSGNSAESQGAKVVFLGAHLPCSSRMKGFEGLEASALPRVDLSLQSFQIL